LFDSLNPASDSILLYNT